MPIFPSLDVKVTRLPLPLSPGGKSQASAFTEARNEEGKHSNSCVGGFRQLVSPKISISTFPVAVSHGLFWLNLS